MPLRPTHSANAAVIAGIARTHRRTGWKLHFAIEDQHLFVRGPGMSALRCVRAEPESPELVVISAIA
jgi:hypothetical protein